MENIIEGLYVGDIRVAQNLDLLVQTVHSRPLVYAVVVRVFTTSCKCVTSQSNPCFLM